MVKQGDIYWVQFEESAIPHPHVVIQDDVNQDSTVAVCALTSNIKRVNMPGNMLLDEGEGNLPRQSVVEVSKVSTVDVSRLGDYIGSLGKQRVEQILAGMRFVQVSFLKR